MSSSTTFAPGGLVLTQRFCGEEDGAAGASFAAGMGFAGIVVAGVVLARGAASATTGGTGLGFGWSGSGIGVLGTAGPVVSARCGVP